MYKENFSLESLNPVDKLKELGKRLLVWIVEIIVIGVVCLVVMQKCGLMETESFKNYIVYFFAAATLLYALTFAYFAYKCRTGKLDLTKLAKVSTLGPAVLLLHVAILFGSRFIEVVPEVGILIYGLIWSSIGVIGVTGIAYTFGLSIAEATFRC